jgi:hypothetical protein
MSNGHYYISDYSILRNQRIVHGGKVLLEGREGKPASFFAEAYKYLGLNYPKFYKMDNLCKLGFLGAELLLDGKNLQQPDTAEGMGIVLFNAASSVDTDRNYQQSIRNRSEYFPSPSVFVYTLANIVVGEICIRHKLYGENAFFIEEKFNASRMFSYVKQLFDEDAVKSCLTGWIEQEGDRYEGMMVLVEKTAPDPDRIVIFDAGTLTKIYAQIS